MEQFAQFARHVRLVRNPNAAEGDYPAECVEVLSKPAWLRAQEEIRSWPSYIPTPLHALNGLAQQAGVANIWYKDEASRFGLGSFKALGGAYAVLRIMQAEILAKTGRVATSEELRAGVFAELTSGMTFTTATDGNHGRAVAWGARMFGAQSTIFLPVACSLSRELAIAGYGASIVRTGFDYDGAVRECARVAKARNWWIVSDTSWDGYTAVPRNVMNGYTLMLAEILAQLPKPTDLTHVFVQAGVGGLAAAVCAFLWTELGERRPRFVVVEPEGAGCLMASVLTGHSAKASEPIRTIMAGLECGEVSPLAWQILRPGADAFLTLRDEVTAPVMRLLATAPYDDPAILASESAIAGLAALLCVSQRHDLKASLELGSDSQVLVLGTEGPTDPLLFRELTGLQII